MSEITIFTSPKPFTKNEHINVIQRNAIASWANLGPAVEVVMIGDEEGMEEVAAEYGVKHIKDVRANALGTPIIPSMFDIAREVTDSPVLAFANADVIFTQAMIDSVRVVTDQEEKFLMIGRRYDIQIDELIDFSQGWQERLLALNAKIGKLHGPTGSDYFIFPRACFVEVPDLVIGRAGWDNWMIYEARQRGWKTINCTGSIPLLHQNHDYSHLPGGKRHYRLPESNENVEAAGGPLHIFPLTDANWELNSEQILRRKLTWKRFWREVEIFPLVKLHDDRLGQLHYYLFHPQTAWRALAGWIKGFTSRLNQ
jgi:hypothetical protein